MSARRVGVGLGVPAGVLVLAVVVLLVGWVVLGGGRATAPSSSAEAPSDRVSVDGGTVTVLPAALPQDVPVVNPGKGWVVYGEAGDYTEPPLDEVADLADVAYTRWSWSQLYTDDDDATTLDFSVVDDFFGDWLARDPDQQLAFGVMAENTGDCTADVPTTPDWVFAAGAAWVPTVLPDRTCRTPVWTDPVLLREYAAMLVALRDHLASRTDGTGDGSTWLSRVQFVGANSYGNYGEGHTFEISNQSCGDGARFETLRDASATCVISEAGFRRHAQMFLDVFTPSDTPVTVPWGSAVLDDEGDYDWTVSQGMGLRRDGIFGPAEWTRGRLGDDLRRAYGLAPTAFERYETSAATDPSRGEFETALRIGRPSFFGLGFAEQALGTWQRDRDLVVDNQRRLGWDFSLARADFPQRWVAGQSATPELVWLNDGLDYSYEPLRVGFALLDDDGGVRATSYPATGANPQRWAPGTTTTERPEVSFDVEPGTYRLAVRIEDRRSEQPVALAQVTPAIPEGWHPLAEVEVGAPVRAAGDGAPPPSVVLEPELAQAATISAVAPGVVARTHVLLRDERLASGMGDRFNAVDPGDAIAYQVDVPRAGRWRLSLQVLADPSGGSLQVAVDGAELGGRVDTGGPAAVRTVEVGELDLAAGSHTLLLTATGPSSGTGSTFVLDRAVLDPVVARTDAP